MTAKILEFPPFAAWLKPIAERGSHAFVRDAEKMILYYQEAVHSLPEKYGWRYASAESFLNQAGLGTSVSEISSAYWTDQARNAEAYAVLTSWRGMDLVGPAITNLNRGDVLAAAVLSRSCLELAATFVLNANAIERIFRETTVLGASNVVSTELEELLVKMIWGTRLGGPEACLKQTNILTVLQKVGRDPQAAEIPDRYSYLCELAHPNFIGNALYWSHVERVNDDGSESRVMMRAHEEGIRDEVVQNILWVLGWSAVCLRNALQLTQSGVGSILASVANAKRAG